MTTQDPNADPPVGPIHPQPPLPASAAPPPQARGSVKPSPSLSIPSDRGDDIYPTAGPRPGQHPATSTAVGSKRGLVPIGVAVLALIIALSSALLSWRAVDQAHDARDIALTGGRGQAGPTTDSPAGEPTIEPTSSPTETTEQPTDDPQNINATAGAPVLNEQTKYSVQYTKEPLQIQTRCNTTVYLDLDEPRVQVNSTVGELAYSKACAPEPGHLRLADGIQGSEISSASMMPADCAERIRVSPIGVDVDLAIRKGRVFCIETSLSAARASADTWKIVIMRISATGEDGTVGLEVTAWNIPT